MQHERVTTLAAVATAFLGLCLVSCSKGPAPARLADFNVIVILIDTLRPDHLGFHDYQRDTSPFLDSLANEAVVFDSAMSNSSFTREAVSALFSGQLPSTSGSYGWHATPSADGGGSHIGDLFHRAGYRTGFFSTTVMLKNPRYTQGFDVAQHLTEMENWTASRTSGQLSDRAVDFVRGCDGDKFMLYLHYLDPHGPYDPPEDMYRRFSTEPPPGDRVRLYGDLSPNVPQYLATGFGSGERRFEEMILRYDAEISDVDRAIGKLFAVLEELELSDRTLVVVTSDHGEEFLEHGFVDHGWTLYEESLRIPLLFWAGSSLGPARVPSRVSLVDVLPSLTTLAGVGNPEKSLDGQSLFEANGTLRPPQEFGIAEVLIQHRNVARTVIKDDWKFIEAQRWLSPAERAQQYRNETDDSERFREEHVDPFGRVLREELFNLSLDPGEQTNLVATHQEQANALRTILADYRSDRSTTGETGPDGLTPEDLEKMKSLGYIGGSKPPERESTPE